MDLRRETDVALLRRVALTQQTQIEQLVRVLTLKCRELEKLKGHDQELQQTLALVEALTKKATVAAPGGEESPPQRNKPKKPRTKWGSTSQPRLPVETERYELDDADLTCPSCGGELEPMAGQSETSEMVDFVEVRYRLVKVEQQKYRCRCGGCVETADGPDRAVKGGRYSLRFAVKVAEDKYLDHLPLARQSRMLRRRGLNVTSQTLWDQLEALSRRLRPVDDALLGWAMRQPVIGLDQTGWKRLEKGARHKTPWQMWCVTAPGVVVHRIRKDKGAETFRELVGGYDGTIVCDALKTHEAGARDGPAKLAGCWAHVYRKFAEAEPDHPEAHMMLRWIRRLYDVDEEAGDDVEQRGHLRRSRSQLILDDMKTWLRTLPNLQSVSVGNAAQYTLGHWERLTRFITDPQIPLDNNATERGIRGPVVGRKNHYGSKSERGTRVAATFYTLFETAKLHDIDPPAYLLAAARAADQGEILLPWDFAAASPR